MQACYPTDMKRIDCKSHCPINFALETFGDPWSMLILRDIVYFGKKTYSEFLASEERMATNVLANRLEFLEDKGVLVSQPHPADRRKEVYELTQKGLDLIPVLIEMSLWSATYDEETQAPPEWIETVKTSKANVTGCMYQTVKEGGCVFVGDNSVVCKMTRPSAATVTTALGQSA